MTSSRRNRAWLARICLALAVLVLLLGWRTPFVAAQPAINHEIDLKTSFSPDGRLAVVPDGKILVVRDATSAA